MADWEVIGKGRNVNCLFRKLSFLDLSHARKSYIIVRIRYYTPHVHIPKCVVGHLSTVEVWKCTLPYRMTVRKYPPSQLDNQLAGAFVYRRSVELQTSQQKGGYKYPHPGWVTNWWGHFSTVEVWNYTLSYRRAVRKYPHSSWIANWWGEFCYRRSVEIHTHTFL